MGSMSWGTGDMGDYESEEKGDVYKCDWGQEVDTAVLIGRAFLCNKRCGGGGRKHGDDEMVENRLGGLAVQEVSEVESAGEMAWCWERLKG